MNIYIDTNAVKNAAIQIANTNQKISNDFSSVETAVSSLYKTWDGAASNVAIGKFNHIKSTYCDNRFKVVNDMVNFLKNQVGEGYEQTEKVITSAAAAFK